MNKLKIGDWIVVAECTVMKIENQQVADVFSNNSEVRSATDIEVETGRVYKKPFKSGDYVCAKSNKIDIGYNFFQIQSVKNTHLLLNDENIIQSSFFRHATQEEIDAGRRLP